MKRSRNAPERSGANGPSTNAGRRPVIAKLKLKLNREAAPETSEPGVLRFPSRAVRALPTPQRWMGRATSTKDTSVRPDDQTVFRHPEQVRQIEVTLDRMQSELDQLKEQVENYKFPDAGLLDEDRPKAA